MLGNFGFAESESETSSTEESSSEESESDESDELLPSQNRKQKVVGYLFMGQVIVGLNCCLSLYH